MSWDARNKASGSLSGGACVGQASAAHRNTLLCSPCAEETKLFVGYHPLWFQALQQEMSEGQSIGSRTGCYIQELLSAKLIFRRGVFSDRGASRL